MISYILTDIEGTTTPITFVHDVLFPYSTQHLPDYIRSHADQAEVKKALEQTNATIREEHGVELDLQGAIDTLLRWVKEDRKHPALKSLQGLVWRHGYESKAFTSVVYPDVKPTLERWHAEGSRLGIYSSGSVAAQQLLFRYTDSGDLTPLFSDYFDTKVGAKRETTSYQNILEALKLPGEAVLFLSDIPEELDAAQQVGIRTLQLIRPGTKPTDRHPTASNFYEVAQWLAS